MVIVAVIAIIAAVNSVDRDIFTRGFRQREQTGVLRQSDRTRCSIHSHGNRSGRGGIIQRAVQIGHDADRLSRCIEGCMFHTGFIRDLRDLKVNIELLQQDLGTGGGFKVTVAAVFRENTIRRAVIQQHGKDLYRAFPFH